MKFDLFSVCLPAQWTGWQARWSGVFPQCDGTEAELPIDAIATEFYDPLGRPTTWECAQFVTHHHQLLRL